MGRLIDADALDDVVQKLNENGWEITRDEYKRISNVLFEFPTIEERKTEWHPYPKEKPTREDEYYLVTALRGGEYHVCTTWWIDETYCFGVCTDSVTAWAELPKPYEEGAEE